MTISHMSSANSERSATLQRRTGETEVRLSLTLEGSGSGTRASGVGFLDHMLDLLARHGRLDLDVAVSGDLQTGSQPIFAANETRSSQKTLHARRRLPTHRLLRNVTGIAQSRGRWDR